MKKNVIFSLFVISTTNLFSLVPWYKFLPKEFPQGKKNQHSNFEQNIRSVNLYREYSSLGSFDFLWFCADVRRSYTHMYGRKRGLSSDTQSIMLAQHNQNADEVITFYILCETYNQPERYLSDKLTHWNIHLVTSRGDTVQPKEIKEIELCPELQAIFGRHYSSYKRAYLVTFPAKNMQGIMHIEKKSQFKIVICSSLYSAQACWDSCNKQKNKNRIDKYVRVDKSGRTSIIKNEDFYW